MLPPDAAVELELLGHDASSVLAAGLASRPDSDLLSHAVEHRSIIVTENWPDFVALVKDRLEHGAPIPPMVFVDRRRLPRRGALGHHLAARLDRWANDHPDPWPGVYWLPTGA